ncbi:MAG: ABC transporter permease [Christensenellales bacterium]|jgi:putative aldouronate transport system permease protein
MKGKVSTAISTTCQVPRWRNTLRLMRRNWVLYLLLLPAIVYIAIFCYAPMYGIQIAFRNFNFADGITGSKWVGMKWFRFFFNSVKCWPLINNTLIISFYSLLAGFPIPIILALMLHNIPSQKFKRTAQTLTYLPHFISLVVVVGMISCFTSINSGWINTLIEALGGERVYLMGKPEYYRHLYVWSGVWQQAGWGSIIYMAALTSVDPELHEAATIDGATKLQRIRHIDLPSILPTITIMLILRCGSIMSVGFDKSYLMMNDLNRSVSEVISTYIYEMGLLSGKYSYSTAISLFNNVINFIFLTVVNQFGKIVSGNSLW